jgi:type III restriction enzyme
MAVTGDERIQHRLTGDVRRRSASLHMVAVAVTVLVGLVAVGACSSGGDDASQPASGETGGGSPQAMTGEMVLRPCAGAILTEQTLGRGMRLPFGAYTGIEILDTLEVVAHERYEDLLKKAGVLNEAFVDYRTRAALRVNAQGQTVVVSESVETAAMPLISELGAQAPAVQDDQPMPVVTSVQERAAQVTDAALKMKIEIQRRPDAPEITIPALQMTAVKSTFSLADITDNDRFRKLGAALAANPDGELNRTLVGARVVIGLDGIKRTELVRSSAADRIRSIPSLFSLGELIASLTDIILASPAVPARKDQQAALQPLLGAFFDGLGGKAEDVLSANLERAGARLVRLVAEEQRRYMAKPSYDEVVRLDRFDPVRATDKTVSSDRFGPFSRSLAYDDWSKSLFGIEWFDSTPERTVANMVDGDDNVTCWVRLHVGELPILWSSAGQQYNPDLIVIENNSIHWVVEVKMDKEMASADVQGKREAAKRWANHVSADATVGVEWRYLLVSESDVNTARGSWDALKRLGQ